VEKIKKIKRVKVKEKTKIKRKNEKNLFINS